jgi:hypothetical protein
VGCINLGLQKFTLWELTLWLHQPWVSKLPLLKRTLGCVNLGFRNFPRLKRRLTKRRQQSYGDECLAKFRTFLVYLPRLVFKSF